MERENRRDVNATALWNLEKRECTSWKEMEELVKQFCIYGKGCNMSFFSYQLGTIFSMYNTCLKIVYAQGLMATYEEWHLQEHECFRFRVLQSSKINIKKLCN